MTAFKKGINESIEVNRSDKKPLSPLNTMKGVSMYNIDLTIIATTYL